MHRFSAFAVMALVLAGCGGSGMTMAEYGDRLDGIRETYAPPAEAAWLEFLEIPEPTPIDVKALADTEVAIRRDIEEEFRALEPPSEITELHELLAEWITAMREAGAGLASRAGLAASWNELLDSEEFTTFEATLVGGTQVCNEFQAELDATAARGVFADTPWIPGDLQDVADAVIGCEAIPNSLDESFRR